MVSGQPIEETPGLLGTEGGLCGDGEMVVVEMVLYISLVACCKRGILHLFPILRFDMEIW